MTERGKKYVEAIKLVEKDKEYTTTQAAELTKKMHYVKFDETVNLSLRMGVDPRNANQQVRGVAVLPNGLGKKVRVLVFAQGENEKAAIDAGADFAGSDDLIKKIEGGWTEFDIAMATPDMMARVGRLGKVLGRKGLMPNPKAGTVIQPNDLAHAISDARKGRVEFKLDRSSIIHVPVGKISFEEKAIAENVDAVIDAVNRAKPTGAKGTYVQKVAVSSTMGPGVRVDVATLA